MLVLLNNFRFGLLESDSKLFLLMTGPCSAPDECLDRGCEEPSGGRSDGLLEVLGKSSVPVEPGDGPLDDPTAGQDFEALGWVLAEPMHRIRRLMEARSGKEGRREFIQVLRLCEKFEQTLVEWAVARALEMGAISFDAVKMIALARLEQRPPRLDLELYPHLPRAHVGRTNPRSYLGLLSGTTASAPGAAA